MITLMNNNYYCLPAVTITASPCGACLRQRDANFHKSKHHGTTTPPSKKAAAAAATAADTGADSIIMIMMQVRGL